LPRCRYPFADAVAALAFLILVHKLEYFSTRIVGTQPQIARMGTAHRDADHGVGIRHRRTHRRADHYAFLKRGIGRGEVDLNALSRRA
jgi:hypothetical protein